MLIVLQTFSGHGFDMPNVGSFIDPPEPSRSYLLSIGVVAEYETKVTEPPKATKKKPLQSAPAGRASQKRTAKRSKKTARK